MSGTSSSGFVQGALIGGGVVFFVAGIVIVAGVPGGIFSSSPGSVDDGTTTSGVETTQGTNTTASPTRSTAEQTTNEPTSTETTTTTTTTTSPPNSQGEVLYRVNVGGRRLAATDGGPAWQRDTERRPSRYGNARASGSHTNETQDTISLTSAVPEGTPRELFQSRRYDADTHRASDDPEMEYRFPTGPGTYEVRLHFVESYLDDSGWNDNDAKGPRKFDVEIEGNRVLNDYDMYEELGHDRGTTKSFTVTVRDGALDVRFLHEQEDPMLSGIEVVRVSGGDGGNRGDDDDDDRGPGSLVGPDRADAATFRSVG